MAGSRQSILAKLPRAVIGLVCARVGRKYFWSNWFCRVRVALLPIGLAFFPLGRLRALRVFLTIRRTKIARRLFAEDYPCVRGTTPDRGRTVSRLGLPGWRHIVQPDATHTRRRAVTVGHALRSLRGNARPDRK
ncbi:MAG: hypothetical protein H0W30_17300 [Gemmatimonadaceae bacterium]|nr:hypothetical protein [Gemmatimonadaceae bacterium]MDQ3517043.1 hypothetical protein [Gemmatimonadota bacterium]